MKKDKPLLDRNPLNRNYLNGNASTSLPTVSIASKSVNVGQNGITSGFRDKAETISAGALQGRMRCLNNERSHSKRRVNASVDFLDKSREYCINNDELKNRRSKINNSYDSIKRMNKLKITILDMKDEELG